MSYEKLEYMLKIPKIFLANGQDWANYIGHFWNVNMQIQIILEFEDMLDINCMKQAVRLSVDAEPILGCKFVEKEHLPFWERFENIDAINWFILEESHDKDQALKNTLAQPFDSEEQQLQVKIIRSDEAEHSMH